MCFVVVPLFTPCVACVCLVRRSMVTEEEMIRPKHAAPGDVIVLTKPLGTQVAVNLQQWRREPSNWELVSSLITHEQVEKAYLDATASMARLNQNGARLMHKYGAKAGTDVTGFGILGHLTNLAESQDLDVHMELHTLPILEHMDVVDKALGSMFKLLQGRSAETSGGLMVVLPAENAEAFIKEFKELDGNDAWLIGRVVDGNGSKTASIAEDVTVISV